MVCGVSAFSHGVIGQERKRGGLVHSTSRSAFVPSTTAAAYLREQKAVRSQEIDHVKVRNRHMIRGRPTWKELLTFYVVYKPGILRIDNSAKGRSLGDAMLFVIWWKLI